MAAVETIFTGPDALSLAACRAHRTIRPQTRFKVLSGGLYVGKLLKELEGAYCASAHCLILTERILQQALLFCQGKKRENMEYPTLPKPLTYKENEDGTRQATFDRKELSTFLEGVSAVSGVIRNDSGEIVGIARIRPLQEMFLKQLSSL